ncbi:MAG: HAD-IA family hydrolase [Candidatus Bathyarchaeota archaeon]|nr:HAD-IA family hydrolase [Candidatus Bathyarchaeota archaeon]
MLNDVQLIIYDLDGVLIDSSKGILMAFERTFKEIDVHVDPEEIRKRIGVGLLEILEELVPDYPGDPWRLRDRYIHHFQSLNTSFTKLLPGVQETLRLLQEKGFMQAVATNKTSSEAERILTQLGVRRYLDSVTGFMDVPNAKPAPDMILHTLDTLGVSREKAVFVDDTTTGLTAGIRANVATIGITTGTHDRKTIRTVNPDHILDSIDEILDLIHKK